MTEEEYKAREAAERAEAEASGDYVSGTWGFCRYVDRMGSDARIVQAARVSYGQGTKTPSGDADLIYRLLRMGHTSPFEMVEICFHIGVPIFTARQLVRHRTANLNEYSGRYSEMPNEFWTPNPEDIRVQSKTDRQASAGNHWNGAQAAKFIQISNSEFYGGYKAALHMGIPREQARAILPLSQMTYLYWKIDGNNFLKFIGLRDDSHAQSEIQELARAMWGFFAREFPMVAAAYDKAVRKGARLTGPQLDALKEFLRLLTKPMPEGVDARLLEDAAGYAMGRKADGSLKTEAQELMELFGYA